MLALRTTDLDALTEDSADRILWLEHARLVEAQRLALAPHVKDPSLMEQRVSVELFPADERPDGQVMPPGFEGMVP